LPSAPFKTNPRDEKIWETVRRVPLGWVVTYGDVAEAVDGPCTPRQVGSALGRAPAGLGLPWHRVLAAGGRIAIPGTGGLEQRMRLQAEGVTFRGRRARLAEHRYRGQLAIKPKKPKAASASMKRKPHP
jgi:methylated-DNA-protein-cysteine methyltransferase-like protein